MRGFMVSAKSEKITHIYEIRKGKVLLFLTPIANAKRRVRKDGKNLTQPSWTLEEVKSNQVYRCAMIQFRSLANGLDAVVSSFGMTWSMLVAEEMKRANSNLV